MRTQQPETHRADRMFDTSALLSPSTWLLAFGPITFGVTFFIRSIRPVADPTLLGICVLLIAATVGTILLNRIAAGVLLVVTAATFQPVVARDISFSLSSIDSGSWRAWAIVSVLSIGWTLLAALIVLVGRPVTTRVGSATAVAGASLGVALLGVFPLLSDQPAYGEGLTATEIAELPEILLVNYAYGLPHTDIPSTETYRAKLVNPSDLPHTFTIDAIDVDVFVPAGRWAIVEIPAHRLTTEPVPIVCTIGDHEDLGMRATLAADS